MITQRFDLNLIPKQDPTVIHVDQYDIGTGRLIASLYDGDIPYSVSGTAIIQGTKPDTKGFAYRASISGNTVTANVTEQMTAVAGDVRTQIVITETSGRTGSFAFILRVQKSALPDDTDMSESDYALIEEGIEAAAEAKISENNAAISATQAEESATASAGSATQAANSATQSAESASASALSATQAAGSVTAAANSATKAESESDDAEAWAVGKRKDVEVPITDETYHNNSKYYAEQSEDSADASASSAQAAKASEQAAKTSEGILDFYVDFVIPRFVIQNNRLYVSNTAVGEFVVANNRLYIKNAS